MASPNRPVDMSDDFRENGWEYCKYLITDPRCDHLLQRNLYYVIHYILYKKF